MLRFVGLEIKENKELVNTCYFMYDLIMDISRKDNVETGYANYFRNSTERMYGQNIYFEKFYQNGYKKYLNIKNWYDKNFLISVEPAEYGTPMDFDVQFELDYTYGKNYRYEDVIHFSCSVKINGKEYELKNVSDLKDYKKLLLSLVTEEISEINKDVKEFLEKVK